VERITVTGIEPLREVKVIVRSVARDKTES